MTWDNTHNRKPTIREHIQMDLQHDWMNSRIKYWGGLAFLWVICIAMWSWIAS